MIRKSNGKKYPLGAILIFNPVVSYKAFCQFGNYFKPFLPNVVLHIETSDLMCNANQMTGFYMKYNTAQLRWF